MKLAHLHPIRLTLVCCCGLLAVPADAETTIGGPWLVNTIVPDNSPLGMSDVRQVNSGIVSIMGVTLTLNVTGGYAGDLFAYVVHDSGYAVLLNRIGRSSSNLFGNPASGLQITFTDSAPTDIHLVANSTLPLIGIYQPDGRTADPSLVLNTSPRSALLSSFNGLPASGNWTLFAADLSAGDEATVQSWGLEITGVVPEPGAAALCAWALGLLGMGRRRGNPGGERDKPSNKVSS